RKHCLQHHCEELNSLGFELGWRSTWFAKVDLFAFCATRCGTSAKLPRIPSSDQSAVTVAPLRVLSSDRPIELPTACSGSLPRLHFRPSGAPHPKGIESALSPSANPASRSCPAVDRASGEP